MRHSVFLRSSAVLLIESVLCLLMTVGSNCCVASNPSAAVTNSSLGCCPALNQTLTTGDFPDGTMTFTYNSDTCRQTVVANCSVTDASIDLYAAIVANGVNFLDYANGTVTFPGTCNATDMEWYMGDPPLEIATLECILTNTPV